VTYGIDRLVADLEELGFKPRKVSANGSEFVVLDGFEIQSGCFEKRIIDLGLQATPDFPRTVHASIHVRANPQLYEVQNVPNVRNIQASVLGPEWRYWSKNFGWSGAGHSARRLISQINSIFDRA